MSNINIKSLMGWYSLAIVVFALDFLSKCWVSNHLSLHESWTLTSFFSFTLTYNEGAAFSFLSNAGGWQRWFLATVAAVFSVVIVVWMARLAKDKWRESLALSFILGGAIGNLYDRVNLGYVIDFILVHYKGHYFPAFNVADSAICVGAFILIVDTLFFSKEKDHA